MDKPKEFEIDISFMAQAIKMATRSVCQKRKVGCVIVKEDSVIARGFNTVPGFTDGLEEISITELCPGRDSCTGFGKTPCLTTIHAEVNAISKAPQELLSGATLYTTLLPCSDCFKSIVSCGIKNIVWFDSKPFYFTKQYYMGLDFYDCCERFGVRNYPCREMYNSFHKNFMDESKRKNLSYDPKKTEDK